MLTSTLSQFHALRAPVRSLILLFWVYDFTGALLGIFTQLYLYQQFQSVILNVQATMLFFTGIAIGFVGAGYVASRMQINIKNGFLVSFLINGIAIVMLFYSSTIETAYAAMLMYGIGTGLFALTMHTFELAETNNQERDFYSSLLSAGGQIFSFVGPVLATLLIWLSEAVLDWGTFTLLFIISPIFYLVGFLYFSGISDYKPQKIKWSDIKYFFTEKRNLVAQLYLLGSSIGFVVASTIPPLALLIILGGAFEVGFYNTVLAIFSALFILILAKYRTVNNRLRIFGLATLAAVMVTILFGTFFGLMMLVVYTIAMAILKPILRVSEHVIDLETMESIGRSGVDFYPTMILRDFSLFVWRMVGAGIFLLLLYIFPSEEQLFAVGFYFIAASLVITFLGAHLLLNQVRHDDT